MVALPTFPGDLMVIIYALFVVVWNALPCYGLSANATTPTVRNEYLALAVACRDQHRDLPEWLQHHHQNMGVNRFYILDDRSDPPLSTAAKTYGVPEDVLTFIYWPLSEHVDLMQKKMYDAVAASHGKNHTWMAFIDTDEFFDTPGNETLIEFLKTFESQEKVGAVVGNWRVHTSNGLLTRQESLRKSFTKCVWDGSNSNNREFKSIVKTKHYGHFISPHFFHTTNDTITVDEKGELIKDRVFRFPVTRDRLAVHHYMIKSKEEFQEKMNRGNGENTPKNWGFWDYIEKNLEHVNCTEMTRWVK